MTWAVDTLCPDTTFVVLPDVVTHLTSEVLVVEGGPDAASFQYSVAQLGVGKDGDASSSGSGIGSSSSSSGSGGKGGTKSNSGSDSGSGSKAGVGNGEGTVSTSSGGDDGSASAGGDEDDETVWHEGDVSGVIHLHHLQVCVSFDMCDV